MGKQQAEAQANAVAETEAKIHRLRLEIAQANPNLEHLDTQIQSLASRELDLTMSLEELQNEETEAEIKEQKAKIEATKHKSDLAKLERKLKRAQVKVEMKRSIEERRQAAGLSASDKM